MKTAIRWFTSFVLFAMFLVTSAICSAGSLTSLDLQWQALFQPVIAPPPLNLSLYIMDNGNTSSQIMITAVSPSDTGTTFVSTPNDPGFSNFVGYLTNGINDSVIISLANNSGSFQFGSLWSKTDLFGGSSLTTLGAISNVSLKVNELTVAIPGNDWNHNGTNTDVTADMQVSINTYPDSGTVVFLPSGSGGSGGGSGGSGSMVAPEPNTLFLLATGLAVLAFPLWKKRKQILH